MWNALCGKCRFFLNEGGGVCGRGLEPNTIGFEGECSLFEAGSAPVLQGEVLSYWEWNTPNRRVEQCPKALKADWRWKIVHFKVERKILDLKRRTVEIEIGMQWKAEGQKAVDARLNFISLAKTTYPGFELRDVHYDWDNKMISINLKSASNKKRLYSGKLSRS